LEFTVAVEGDGSLGGSEINFLMKVSAF